MTITDSTRTDSSPDPSTTAIALPATVTVDLYRDIHKGIRAELFAVTQAAARVDPADPIGKQDLAAHVASVSDLLTAHAHHEDDAIDPVLELHEPALAARITADHERLEAHFASVCDQILTAASTNRSTRTESHAAHLDLASFVSEYLAHQDLEERVVMPALELAVGSEVVAGINAAIVASIPPEQMASSLAIMLPAMNLDDRFEMLGGMRLGAPPEVYAGVVDLARSVLHRADFEALARRLDG